MLSKTLLAGVPLVVIPGGVTNGSWRIALSDKAVRV